MISVIRKQLEGVIKYPSWSSLRTIIIIIIILLLLNIQWNYFNLYFYFLETLIVTNYSLKDGLLTYPSCFSASWMWSGYCVLHTLVFMLVCSIPISWTACSAFQLVHCWSATPVQVEHQSPFLGHPLFMVTSPKYQVFMRRLNRENIWDFKF